MNSTNGFFRIKGGRFASVDNEFMVIAEPHTNVYDKYRVIYAVDGFLVSSCTPNLAWRNFFHFAIHRNVQSPQYIFS